MMRVRIANRLVQIKRMQVVRYRSVFTSQESVLIGSWKRANQDRWGDDPSIITHSLARVKHGGDDDGDEEPGSRTFCVRHRSSSS